MALVGNCCFDYVRISTLDNYHLLTKSFLFDEGKHSTSADENLNENLNYQKEQHHNRKKRRKMDTAKIAKFKNLSDTEKQNTFIKSLDEEENFQLREDFLRNAIIRLFDGEKVSFTVKNKYFSPSSTSTSITKYTHESTIVTDTYMCSNQALKDESEEAFPMDYNPEDIVYYEFSLTLEEAFYLSSELNLLQIKNLKAKIEIINDNSKSKHNVHENTPNTSNLSKSDMEERKEKDNERETMSFYTLPQLWQRFIKNVNFRRRYFCHRHYRQRGFLIGKALQHGADFSLYIGLKSDYHSNFLVYIYSNQCCSRFYLQNTFFLCHQNSLKSGDPSLREDLDSDSNEERRKKEEVLTSTGTDKSNSNKAAEGADSSQLLDWSWAYADALSRNAQDAKKRILLVSVSSLENVEETESFQSKLDLTTEVDRFVKVSEMVLASKNPKLAQV